MSLSYRMASFSMCSIDLQLRGEVFLGGRERLPIDSVLAPTMFIR